ncbi:hypothetical protein SESBI_37159 [Sesbania bispinosa]|nr:hypothetical protein SESBI_37159 [Sesbania bispinosa]
MSKRVTYLPEIVSGRVDRKIRVKVIRLWNGTDFVDRSIKNTIEMVLVDEKGTRMQYNIKKALMASFENVFTERSGYLIQNIMVAHNDGRFKTSPHRKNHLGCTLWNDYAEEVESYLSNKHHTSSVVIVILQFCNVGISSYYETSKMMLNAEVKEVEDYRSWLEASEVSITQVLSQPSTDTFLSESDDLMQTKRMAIAEIVESSEDQDIGGKWLCEGKNCMRIVNSVRRYMINLNVIDASGSTNFVIFDKVGLKLFGKSVGEMIKSKQDFVEYENERNSEMADNNADVSIIVIVHNCDGSLQIAENLKGLSPVNIAETPTSKQVSKRSHESADLISIVDNDGSQTSSSKIPKLGDLNEVVMKLKDVKKEPTD